MLKRLLVTTFAICLMLLNIATANNFKEGKLTLKQVIDSSKVIANATPYKKVSKKLSGTIVTIEGKEYEIRYFNFEDVRLRLPKKMTFKKYIYKNNLDNLKSLLSSPLPNINFETFDYRMAKISDDVFFSISLRSVELNDNVK